MKKSIVELTPMNLDSGRNTEEKMGLVIEAIKRNAGEIVDIMRRLEARIKALENK